MASCQLVIVDATPCGCAMRVVCGTTQKAKGLLLWRLVVATKRLSSAKIEAETRISVFSYAKRTFFSGKGFSNDLFSCFSFAWKIVERSSCSLALMIHSTHTKSVTF